MFILVRLLPPAYVVRREGTVFTGVCLSTGGGQVSPAGGGVRSVQLAGGGVSPAGGGGVRSVQLGGQGGVRSVQPGGVSQWEGGQFSSAGGGVSQWGDQVSQARGGGVSQRGGGGRGLSAKIGQQNEYSLHGGRYASCVHAGGLSCSV